MNTKQTRVENTRYDTDNIVAAMSIKTTLSSETEHAFRPVESSTGNHDTSTDQAAPKGRYHHRFDFEIGYFVESPCKVCRTKSMFPKCLDSCKTLDNIHSLLAASVSCTQRR